MLHELVLYTVECKLVFYVFILNYYIILYYILLYYERLDQGRLHPILEVPGLTCPGPVSAVGGEHSRKEPLEQLVNSFLEHLEISARPVINAPTWQPPMHVLHEHT